MTAVDLPGFGQVLRLGRRSFARCWDCGRLVRVDKPGLGSLHYCVTDETAARQPWRQRPASRETLGVDRQSASDGSDGV